MGLLFNTTDDNRREAEEQERLRKKEQLNRFLGTPIRREESFQSQEFDEFGNVTAPRGIGTTDIPIEQGGAISQSDFNNLETTQTPSGLLGGGLGGGQGALDVQANGLENRTAANMLGAGESGQGIGPEDLTKFKAGLLEAGFSSAEINSVSEPTNDAIDHLRTLQRDFLNNDFAKDAVGRARRAGRADKELAEFDRIIKTNDKFVTPSRDALQQFKTTTEVLDKRGGFDNLTPQDDLAMITSFAKMLKPGEAVQVDDVENVLRSSSFPEMIAAFVAAKGGKALDPDVRRGIYAAMTAAFDEIKPQYQQIRAQTEGIIDAANFQRSFPKATRKSILDTRRKDAQGNAIPFSPFTEGAPEVTGGGTRTLADMTDAELSQAERSLRPRGRSAGSVLRRRKAQGR